MKTAYPKDLFLDQLQDIYSAETQVLAALPGMTKKVTYNPLAAVLIKQIGHSHHRSELASSMLLIYGSRPGRATCKAMEGLIAGGREHLDAIGIPATMDLLMVAHWMRIAHYLSAAYGFTARLAKRLGYYHEARFLNGIHGQELLLSSDLKDMEQVLFEASKEDSHHEKGFQE